ncbi:MAG: glycosyltransferase family 4 protein [Candidatus Paceibacterota bacterium]
MRVGFVTNSTINVIHYRLPWIKQLERRGVSVTVFSPVDERIDTSAIRHIPWEVDRHSRSVIRLAKEAYQLSRLLRRERIDVVQSFTPRVNMCGTLAARFAGVPVIVSTITGLGTLFIDRKASITARLIRKAFRAIVSWSDFLVFQNSDDRAVFSGVDDSRAFLVHGSGVDPEKFRPAAPSERERCRAGLGFAPNQIVLVYAGRLLGSKGLRELCVAVDEVALRGYPVLMVFAGDIDEGNPDSLSADELRALERAPFRFLGFRKDMRELLAACDGVVFPSHREGMPFPVVEAMLMERPVITTDVPGCRATIEHETSGFLVERENVLQLTRAIERLVSDPARAAAMGRNGRERALKIFSLPAILKELDGLYDTIEQHYERNKGSSTRFLSARGTRQG